MQIFLHIGHFKTGTSSLQHVLSSNREQLASVGICYPLTDDQFPNQHGNLVKFATHQGEYEALLKLVRDVRDKGYKKLILSAEVASNGTRESTDKMVRLLSSYGSVAVIYVIRHWAEYLPSRYAQNVKRGDGWSWFEFLRHCEENFDNLVDINYWLVVQNFLSAQKLFVQVYDSGVISRVMELMGLSLFKLPVGKENITSNANIVEVRRLANLLVQANFEFESNLHFMNLKNSTLSRPYADLGIYTRQILGNNEWRKILSNIVDETSISDPFTIDFPFERWTNYILNNLDEIGIETPEERWTSNCPKAFTPSFANLHNNKQLAQLFSDHIQPYFQNSTLTEQNVTDSRK